GVELNEMAVRQLFEDLQLVPTTTATGGMTCLNAGDLEVFVGDFFTLAPDMLDPVDAVFDRGALVALPEDMRARYARHLTGIAGHAPQLLVTFEYDQTQMDGPPFSIGDADVRRHYQDSYRVSSLASVDVAGKLKGKCDATENVWLLHPRRDTSAS
ncbi:MAG: thiopurine S-methyltransferase, partial [Pseudomonadota bacterium]